MPGKRQPTDIVKAKGLKHMTQAEEDARRDQEVHVPPPDKAVPPKWLPKKHHNEFCEIGEILRTAGLYAELDRDVLAQYFVCRERWLHADKLAAKASGIRTRSWPRNGPASSPPISSRPVSVRSPWGCPLPAGAGSWCLRRWSMRPEPLRRMTRTNSPGRCGPDSRPPWDTDNVRTIL